MAYEKKAKTAASKKDKKIVRPLCPKCGAVRTVVKYAALPSRHYPEPPLRGLFWQCSADTCDYLERT